MKFRPSFSRLQKSLSELRRSVGRWLFDNGEINLILSHPKTGGNSLHAAVATLRPYSCVLFSHSTHVTTPEKRASELQQRLPSMGFHGDADRKQRLVTGTSVNMRLVEKAGAAVDEFFRKSTEGEKGGGTLNIIASVREPVACYLSGYYQILGGTGFKNLSHEDVVRDVEGLIRTTTPVNQMLWWNREIKGRFGIDVLATPFDKQRGWEIYESGRIRLLVVRQENFDALGDALGALFGVDSDKIRLFKRNTAAGKKKLAADYARKINDCALDGELLDQVYDNSWFQTFYTPEEEAVFREKWGGGASVSG